MVSWGAAPEGNSLGTMLAPRLLPEDLWDLALEGLWCLISEEPRLLMPGVLGEVLSEPLLWIFSLHVGLKWLLLEGLGPLSKLCGLLSEGV